MRTQFLVPLLVTLSAAATLAMVAVGDGSVVTLADYFDLGERQVARALASRTNSDGHVSMALVESVARAVVRVRIQHNFHGETFSTSHATGALVQHGKYVVTVAHEMEVMREYPDARIEILLMDGRVLAGRKRALDHYVPDRTETDWAFLDVVDPPADLPSLELGDPIDGERLVLGFPGRHGRDVADRVVLDDEEKALPLRPLRILCHTRASDAAQLELSAGCVPIGGISGAPCIDARGRLISIQRGVTDTITNGHAVSTLNVVATNGLRAAIAKAEAPK